MRGDGQQLFERAVECFYQVGEKMRKPLKERFFAKVKKTEECWEWQACLDRKGYGRFWKDGRNCHAHRVSYELIVGPLTRDQHLDHLCRNTICVNPSHLEPVSLMENVAREDTFIGRKCREKLTRQQIESEIWV